MGSIEEIGPQMTWSTDEAQFWWSQLSPPLLSLMQSAGYSAENQEKYAKFVGEFVVPSLGPRPKTSKSGALLPHFDSFCSDDFSPAELSWNVTSSKSVIRVGSEPIGRFAGTAKDPFNQEEPQNVMTRLLDQSKGAVDGTLWNFFKKNLHVDPKHGPAIVEKMAPNEHMTTNTISFDLSGDDYPLPKVYFYPIPISHDLNEYAGEIITDVFSQLPVNLTPGFDVIKEFVYSYKKQRSHEMILRVELIAFDCVRPEESRFKVYLRTKETCLARVEEIYTLGGRLKGPEIEAGLELIRSFYLRVLGLSAPEESLPESTHRTAGIIFNFEIMHNDPTPKAKVYIPVRHYCGTDLRVAQSLSTFLGSCGFNKIANTYIDAVQNAFPTQNFSETIGRHSYVCLSYNNKGPYVTMYYNTMTFSTGSERNEHGKIVGPAAMRQRHILD